MFLFSPSIYGFEKEVQNAVKKQLEIYPKSRLQDIYKNFFQDRFGPGHLIADTTAAANYLRRELGSYSQCSGPVLETTGWEGNFYRVNLSVLKENKIPWQVFFDAFIESVNTIKAPLLNDWIREWNEIAVVIDNMNLNLPDYETDQLKINDLLSSGSYVMHHSKAFEEHYDPHYRIIRKDIFEQQLKKYIE